LFLAFGLVDQWIDPVAARRVWPVRLAIAVALAAVAAFSLSRAWDAIRGKVLWGVALVAAIGMFVLIAAGRPHAELRWVGLVLVVLGADTLLRLMFLALVGLASAVIVAWMATVAIADDLTTEAAFGEGSGESLPATAPSVLD
jgi:hypothetical protein